MLCGSDIRGAFQAQKVGRSSIIVGFTIAAIDSVISYVDRRGQHQQLAYLPE